MAQKGYSLIRYLGYMVTKQVIPSSTDVNVLINDLREGPLI